MRYVGQNFELSIPVEREEVDGAVLGRIVETFHENHEREYGYSSRTSRVQFVNYRITALGDITKIRLKDYSGLPSEGDALVERRPVYFDQAGGYARRRYSTRTRSAGHEDPGASGDRADGLHDGRTSGL
jgi:N-methylhydantoinase A